MLSVKQVSLTAAITALVFLAQLALMPRSAQAEKMGKEEIEERWEKMEKKGWSQEEMKQVMKLSKGDSEAFDKIASLKNNDVPMRAIAQSFQIADGKIQLVKEFWDYVRKYKFSPKEVAKVIKTFPPNTKQRWKYFAYRVGGEGQLDKRKETKKKKVKKLKQSEKGYPQKEVMNIFKRARFDTKLVKKYFSQRDSGVSKQKAWGKIRKEIQAQKEKERQKQEEKRQAEEKRRKEREEKRQKLKEYQERQKKAQEKDSEEEEEGAKTTTLKSLLGGDDGSESEEKNDGDESTNKGGDENQEQADEQKEKQDNSSKDEKDKEE